MELLQQNLVHIIASDGHTARGTRKPLLSAGVAAAARVVGREAARNMVEDIPQAILQDRKPDLDGLPKAPRQRWWSLRR
jgi:protein-tyrosine phosphatase